MCAGGRATSEPGLHRTWVHVFWPARTAASYPSVLGIFPVLLLRALQTLSPFFQNLFTVSLPPSLFSSLPWFLISLGLFETVRRRPSRPGTILQARNGVNHELLSSLSRARVGEREVAPPSSRPVASSVIREPRLSALFRRAAPSANTNTPCPHRRRHPNCPRP